ASPRRHHSAECRLDAADLGGFHRSEQWRCAQPVCAFGTAVEAQDMYDRVGTQQSGEDSSWVAGRSASARKLTYHIQDGKTNTFGDHLLMNILQEHFKQFNRGGQRPESPVRQLVQYIASGQSIDRSTNQFMGL